MSNHTITCIVWGWLGFCILLFICRIIWNVWLDYQDYRRHKRWLERMASRHQANLDMIQAKLIAVAIIAAAGVVAAVLEDRKKPTPPPKH